MTANITGESQCRLDQRQTLIMCINRFLSLPHLHANSTYNRTVPINSIWSRVRSLYYLKPPAKTLILVTTLLLAVIRDHGRPERLVLPPGKTKQTELMQPVVYRSYEWRFRFTSRSEPSQNLTISFGIWAMPNQQKTASK